MTAEVQYLGFVQSNAEKVYGFAFETYAKLKDSISVRVPGQFIELYDHVEERLKPVVSTIVPFSFSILLFADSLVGAGVSLSSDAVTSVQTKGSRAVDSLKGRVQKTLDNEYVTDVKNTAQAKYSSAHGAIISSPTYAQLYAATLNYAKWAISLPVVRKPAAIMYSTAYPSLKGVVDPVVVKVEPYVKALEEHLEPRAGNSPLAMQTDSSASDSPIQGEK